MVYLGERIQGGDYREVDIMSNIEHVMHRPITPNWLGKNLLEQLTEMDFEYLEWEECFFEKVPVNNKKYDVVQRHDCIPALTTVICEYTIYRDYPTWIIVIKNGYSLYLRGDALNYAGNIIRDTLDADFSWNENPIEEIEPLLKSLHLWGKV